MHKTTSLQQSSSTVLLLFLLVLTATATSSSSNKQQDEQQQQGPDINLSMVDIRNDMPPNWPRLYVFGSFQSDEVRIDRGKSYNFLAGAHPELGTLLMDTQCARILAFDPSVELGRHAIYWSVRSDGPYHSWDRSNWQKKASWVPREDC